MVEVRLAGQPVSITLGATSTLALNALTAAQNSGFGSRFPELERVDSFTGVPTSWRNGAGATATGGALVLTDSGFDKQVTTAVSYGLQRRIMEFDFQFTGGNGRLAVFSDPVRPIDSGQAEGSLFVIENTGAAGYQVWFHQRWDGNVLAMSAIDNADKIPLNDPTGTLFALGVNKTYTCRITKHDWDYTVEIYNSAGFEYFSHAVTNTPNHHNATYGDATKYGLWHGPLGWANLAGGPKIMAVRQWADCRERPAFYINGDSKSEGFGCSAADETFGAKLAAILGTDNVAISAVGGRSTVGALQAQSAELAVLRPQNVLIYLGTNIEASGAAFIANLTALCQQAKGIGANVLLGVPVATARQADIASVAAAVGATLVKFNLSTSYDGTNSALIAPYYQYTPWTGGSAYGDGAHEADLGHTQEFNRLLRDAAAEVRAARV